MANIRPVFIAYCSENSEMDGSGFARLCKDSNLLDNHLTASDVDMIFAKFASTDDRQLNFNQFVVALEHLAVHKRCSLYSIELMIQEPNHGATADMANSHDDNRQLSPVPPQEPVSPLSPRPRCVKKPVSPLSSRPQTPTTMAYLQEATTRVVSRASSCQDQYLFISFTDFEKICRRLRTNELFGPPAADALEEAVGLSRGKSQSMVGNKAKRFRSMLAEARVAEAGTSSKGQHEIDTSHFAGSDEGSATGIGDGCKQETLDRPCPQAYDRRHSTSQLVYSDESFPGSRSNSKRPASARSSSCSSRPEARSVHSLLGIFHQRFCSSEDRKIEVDGQLFVQLCKDCDIVNSSFMSTDAERIFRRVATGQCRVTFAQFREALDHAARKKGASVDVLTDGMLIWTLGLITNVMPFGFVLDAPLSKRS
jgi:hypothetical protein